jgi:hypothetical protein
MHLREEYHAPAGKLKVACGKDTNWLLLGADYVLKLCQVEHASTISTKRGGIMTKTIVTLACLLLAPLAFAQPSSKNKKQTTTETVTVTGTIIKMTAEEGAAASYQPLKTLVVREENSKSHDRYVLNGAGHVVDKTGKVIQTAIRPGARVRVYYAHTGDSRAIDHVVLLD